MRLANIVATGVEPQICVAMPCAVLLTVVQHALKDVGNGAVVASTVTRGQNNDIAVSWISCIAFPASVVWYLPVPFWLRLEVTRLRFVILYCSWYYRFTRLIVPVVVDWYIAEEPEQDY